MAARAANLELRRCSLHVVMLILLALGAASAAECSNNTTQTNSRECAAALVRGVLTAFAQSGVTVADPSAASSDLSSAVATFTSSCLGILPVVLRAVRLLTPNYNLDLLQAAAQAFTSSSGWRVGFTPMELARVAEELVFQLQTNVSLYDGWIIDVPASEAVLRGRGAAVLDAFVDADPQQRAWEDDVHPFFLRHVARYGPDAPKTAVVLSGQVQLLYWRRDVLARFGYSQPPATWDDLLAVAARINGTDLDGDGVPDPALCWQSSGCYDAGTVLSAILAPMVQYQGSSSGWLLDPLSMGIPGSTPPAASSMSSASPAGSPAPRTTDTAAAAGAAAPAAAGAPSASSEAPLLRALRLFRTLWQLDSRDGMGCQYLQSRLVEGRCAMMIKSAQQFKYMELRHPELHGLVGASPLPGWAEVWDRARGAWVPCGSSPSPCPHASMEYVLANNASSSANTSAAVNGTSGSAPLPAAPPPPPPLAAAGSAAPGTNGSTSGGGGGAVAAVPYDRARVNRAPVTGMGALLGGADVRAPREYQEAAFQFMSQLASPESSWAQLRIGESAIGPFRRSHLDPANLGRWLEAGYAEADTRPWLAAWSDALEHPNAALPPRMPGADAVRNALTAAAWRVSTGGEGAQAVAAALAAQVAGALTAAVSLQEAQRIYWMTIGFQSPDDGSTAGPASGGGHSALSGGALAAVAACASVGGCVALLLGCYGGFVLVRRQRRLLRKTLFGRALAPGASPLTTLMVTDIVDSTRLWETVQTQAMSRAVQLHHETIRHLLKETGGYESATEGDSFILSFHTPQDAVSFALRAQAALLVQPWPLALVEEEELCKLQFAQCRLQGPAEGKARSALGSLLAGGRTQPSSAFALPAPLLQHSVTAAHQQRHAQQHAEHLAQQQQQQQLQQQQPPGPVRPTSTSMLAALLLSPRTTPVNVGARSSSAAPLVPPTPAHAGSPRAPHVGPPFLPSALNPRTRPPSGAAPSPGGGSHSTPGAEHCAGTPTGGLTVSSEQWELDPSQAGPGAAGPRPLTSPEDRALEAAAACGTASSGGAGASSGGGKAGTTRASSMPAAIAAEAATAAAAAAAAAAAGGSVAEGGLERGSRQRLPWFKLFGSSGERNSEQGDGPRAPPGRMSNTNAPPAEHPGSLTARSPGRTEQSAMAPGSRGASASARAAAAQVRDLLLRASGADPPLGRGAPPPREVGASGAYGSSAAGVAGARGTEPGALEARGPWVTQQHAPPPPGPGNGSAAEPVPIPGLTPSCSWNPATLPARPGAAPPAGAAGLRVPAGAGSAAVLSTSAPPTASALGPAVAPLRAPASTLAGVVGVGGHTPRDGGGSGEGLVALAAGSSGAGAAAGSGSGEVAAERGSSGQPPRGDPGQGGGGGGGEAQPGTQMRPCGAVGGVRAGARLLTATSDVQAPQQQQNQQQQEQQRKAFYSGSGGMDVLASAGAGRGGLYSRTSDCRTEPTADVMLSTAPDESLELQPAPSGASPSSGGGGTLGSINALVAAGLTDGSNVDGSVPGGGGGAGPAGGLVAAGSRGGSIGGGSRRAARRAVSVTSNFPYAMPSLAGGLGGGSNGGTASAAGGTSSGGERSERGERPERPATGGRVARFASVSSGLGLVSLLPTLRGATQLRRSKSRTSVLNVLMGSASREPSEALPQVAPVKCLTLEAYFRQAYRPGGPALLLPAVRPDEHPSVLGAATAGSSASHGASAVGFTSVRVWGGLRVRIGMHAGVPATCVSYNKVAGRTQYSGAALELTKVVCDAAQGGMVLLSPCAFAAYTRSLGRGDRGADAPLLLDMGLHRLRRDSREPANLYMATSRELLPRVPFFGPVRSEQQLLPGVMAAPLGEVSLAAITVAGLPTLQAWDQEATEEALRLFRTVVTAALLALGGYQVEGAWADGRVMAAFGHPCDAVRWAALVEALLKAADWSEALLGHELCEAVEEQGGAADGAEGGGVEGDEEGLVPTRSRLLFRGLRLRGAVDTSPAPLKSELHAPTGRLLYRGGLAAGVARLAAYASTGQVLCTARSWRCYAAASEQQRSAPAVTATAIGAHSVRGAGERLELWSVRYCGEDEPGLLLRQLLQRHGASAVASAAVMPAAELAAAAGEPYDAGEVMGAEPRAPSKVYRRAGGGGGWAGEAQRAQELERDLVAALSGAGEEGGGSAEGHVRSRVLVPYAEQVGGTWEGAAEELRGLFAE